MKKLLFAAILATSVISCDHQGDVTDISAKELSDTNSKSETSKKIIFYASWDEWGRASKGCDGWGLCNLYTCWFCEAPGKYSGKVEVDGVTKEGYLYISLDPSDEIQNTAILNKDVFYVDEDINNENAIVHKGEYEFDSSIGKNGGYKVNITAR